MSLPIGKRSQEGQQSRYDRVFRDGGHAAMFFNDALVQETVFTFRTVPENDVPFKIRIPRAGGIARAQNAAHVTAPRRRDMHRSGVVAEPGGAESAYFENFRHGQRFFRQPKVWKSW